MGRFRLAVLPVLAAAVAAGPACAAAPQVKKYYIPPAKSAGLKPAVPAPATAAAAAPAPGLANRLAAPGAMPRPLLQSSLQRGLAGLPAVGDAGPQCRTACAQTRYACLSTDGDLCDQEWGVCVAGCGS